MSNLTIARGFLECKLHERASRQKIKELQQKNFRKILKHAFYHSSYYHTLYTTHGIHENNLDTISLEDLPIVDKDCIMDNFDDVLTTKDITHQQALDFLETSQNPADLFNNQFHVINTSGSSGKIGIYIYDTLEWDYYFPFITRVFDFQFKRKKSAFFGATNGHYLGISFSLWLGSGLTRFFVKSKIFDIAKPLDEEIQNLNHFQPHILGGYFMGLKLLAEQQESGNLNIHPIQIVNCGEGIVLKEKEYIEEVFQAPLSNLYGLAECVTLGAGKNEYNGIYINEDLCILEIKEDHALLTNLFNKTQPIIRYKINDLIVKKQDTKHLLPFTLVDNIVGRNESMLRLRNDNGEMDFIHPIVIAEIYVKGLDKLQIVVKDDTSFDFLAVIKNEDEQEVIHKIKQQVDKILHGKHFSNIHYTIKPVKNLEIDKKTGKFKLILEKK